MLQVGNRILNYNAIFLFLVISLFYIVLNYLNNLWLLNDQFYYRLLDGSSTNNEIDKFIHDRSSLAWVQYLLIPVVLLVKIAIVAAAVFGSMILYNKHASFRSVFKVALLAEIIVIFASIWRLTYFVVKGDVSVLDLQYYYPLSLGQIFEPTVVPPYLIYPLQIINLFEFLYFLVLSSGLAFLLNDKLTHGIKIVLSGYGVCLLLWMLIVVFIQLQITNS